MYYCIIYNLWFIIISHAFIIIIIIIIIIVMKKMLLMMMMIKLYITKIICYARHTRVKWICVISI